MTLAVSQPAYAEDLFGTWTAKETFPGIQDYATQIFKALGPLAWLVIGFLLASFVISLIVYLVKQAAGFGDGD